MPVTTLLVRSNAWQEQPYFLNMLAGSSLWRPCTTCTVSCSKRQLAICMMHTLNNPVMSVAITLAIAVAITVVITAAITVAITVAFTVAITQMQTMQPSLSIGTTPTVSGW